MTNFQALVTLSMKGEVDKTATAIGLARALQRRGAKVARTTAAKAAANNYLSIA